MHVRWASAQLLRSHVDVSADCGSGGHCGRVWLVAAVDPDAATAITKMYTVDGNPPDNIEGGNYCAVLKAVDETLESADFGVLEDTEDVTC